MFIEIKNDSRNKRYINIFKIIDIQNSFYGDTDEETTKLFFSKGNEISYIYSHEPLKDFMRRLNKELKEAESNVQDRFSIMDL